MDAPRSSDGESSFHIRKPKLCRLCQLRIMLPIEGIDVSVFSIYQMRFRININNENPRSLRDNSDVSMILPNPNHDFLKRSRFLFPWHSLQRILGSFPYTKKLTPNVVQMSKLKFRDTEKIFLFEILESRILSSRISSFETFKPLMKTLSSSQRPILSGPDLLTHSTTCSFVQIEFPSTNHWPSWKTILIRSIHHLHFSSRQSSCGSTTHNSSWTP